MLETHIVINSLIFLPFLTLMLCLAHLFVLYHISLMDITIAHIVLVHQRTALCLDTLVTPHVLIVVIVSRVGIVFWLESLTPALSPDTWTAHVFPIAVYAPRA
jgi:hypothetical protein